MKCYHLPLTCVAGSLAILLGCSAWLVADEASPTAKEKIASLIRQLGSDDFSQREQALAELAEAGEKARAQLAKAAEDADFPEIRARAKQLLVQLDKAQLTASEMHVIGVPGASGYPFQLIDSRRTDWERLCATIVTQGKGDRPSPGKRIWQLLPVDAQVIMNDREGVSVIAKPLKRFEDPEELRKAMRDAEAREGPQGGRLRFKLAKAMDLVLRREDLYDKESFAEIDLAGDGKELAARFDRLTSLENLLLNRRLFEASFPDCVEKLPFSLEDVTLTVHVKRMPRPSISC